MHPVPDGFVDDYRVRTTAAMRSQLTAVAGIEYCLDAIEAANVPYCVASSGTHEKMRTTLVITDLLRRFEGKLFSVTEVDRGKPAPDIFLHAARISNASPETCCVIEDAPAGVTAGVAAGMTVFGYCALTPERRLVEAGAHRTFDRMHHLPGLLNDEFQWD